MAMYAHACVIAAPKAHVIAKLDASGALELSTLWPKRPAGRATKNTPTYEIIAHAKSMRSIDSPSNHAP